MKYRNVFVANKTHLSTKNNCLILDNGEVDSIPLEDIRCIMIESKQTTITAAVLSKLSENGAAVIICDDYHMPTSMLTRVNGYSRQLKQLKLQESVTVPTQKRLWSQIVKSKIENQALCLKFTGNEEGYTHLHNLCISVKSGDPQNIEGKAAAYYFKALFGKEFKRRTENEVNASLNYGYSIIRSYIARTIALYGLEPSLGINHKSELNNFNLADDLIEPFRPIVDLYTYAHLGEAFSTAYRAALFTIINMDMVCGKERCALNTAIERLVQSVIACYKKKQAELCLPVLVDLQYHKYE